MINAYDFDKTIYDGDSTVDFYLYCLKRKKSIIFQLPIQVYAMLLYKLKIKEKEYFKEKFFIFLKKIPNIDLWVEEFWKENISKIKPWYLKQKKKSDIIISASPEFLLKSLEKKLNIKIIATKVDKKNGHFESKNCHDFEKIKRYEKETGNKKNIANFYSDSIKADRAMFEYAENAYLVTKDKVEKLDLNNIK